MVYFGKQSSWYRPMYTNINGIEYQISDIIVYSEYGILYQSNNGWLETEHKDVESFELDDVKRRLKVDFTKKENFIVKDSDDWHDDLRYKLYMYYKNVDYKYLGLSLGSCWLEYKSSVLGYVVSSVIGKRDKIVDEFRYSQYVEDNVKKVDNYNINLEDAITAVKGLKVQFNRIIELKEESKNYTLDDIDKMLYNDSFKKLIELNSSLEVNNNE